MTSPCSPVRRPGFAPAFVWRFSVFAVLATGSSVLTGAPAAPAKVDKFDPKAIVYNLPKTQLRLSGTITATIVAVDLANQLNPYTVELAWDSPKVVVEPIPDPDQYHALPISDSGLFSKHSFGLGLTPEGFLTDGSTATTDRIVPFFKTVLSVAASVVKITSFSANAKSWSLLQSKAFAAYAAVPKTDEQMQAPADPGAAARKMKALVDELAAKRKLYAETRALLTNAPIDLNMTLDEAKRRLEVNTLIQAKIDALLAEIATLSSKLQTEHKVDLAIVPEWKSGDTARNKWSFVKSLKELGWIEIDSPKLEIAITGTRSPQIGDPVPADASETDLYYRVPFAGALAVVIDGKSVVTDIPLLVNQLGWVRSIGVESGLFKNETVTLGYHSATGGLSKVSSQESGGLLAGAETLAGAYASYAEAKKTADDANSDYARLKQETDLLDLKVKKKKALEELNGGTP